MSYMPLCTHRLTTRARRRRCAQGLSEGSRPSMPRKRRRGHIRLFRRSRSRILLLSRNWFSRRRRSGRYRSSSLHCCWRCGRPRRRRNGLQRTRPDQALTTAGKCSRSRTRTRTITTTTTTARCSSRRPLRPRTFLILLLLRRSPSMRTSRGSRDTSIALTPPLR